MNFEEPRYNQFALVREMLESADVVSRFDPDRTAGIAKIVSTVGRLLLTGEGSSRIFPAKNAIRKAMRWGVPAHIATAGSYEASQYALDDCAVMAASNSGQTKEVVALMRRLAELGQSARFGMTARKGTLLGAAAAETVVLSCGWEQAVAATKSVVEQALVYQSLVSRLVGRDMRADLDGAGEMLAVAMAEEINPTIIEAVARAGTVYWAGYNDGVAEELTLKTNEIARKKSDFLEGTYALHGIEEVMNADDVLFIIDPIEAEVDKFKEYLVDGVGVTVVAVSTRGDYPFPVLRVPDAGEMTPFVYLAAGWNVLVETGLALGINLDKPQRARKVGNEFVG